MIEGGVRPRRCAVAAFASLRHSGLHVVRVGGALVVLQMARDASGVGQVVIPIDVTLRTLQRKVRPTQREARLAVIECGIRPRGSGVAAFAGLRHACLRVIGVGGALVLLEVARHACSDSKVEVSIDVALSAGRGDMYPGQRETGLAVIKSGVGP